MKVLQYIDLGTCEIGKPAHLILLDHMNPLLNNEWVYTPLPVKRIMTGRRCGPVFFTADTEYCPGADYGAMPKGCGQPLLGLTYVQLIMSLEALAYASRTV